MKRTKKPTYPKIIFFINFFIKLIKNIYADISEIIGKQLEMLTAYLTRTWHKTKLDISQVRNNVANH